MPAAVDALAGAADDPPEPFGVDVDQLARTRALIPRKRATSSGASLELMASRTTSLQRGPDEHPHNLLRNYT
jgi:hypothetical protein